MHKQTINHPYNTPRNILRLDLSNNQIGDEGAKLIADGLANGVFPITKKINLSGNKISDTGKGFIANAMHKKNQGLVVTFETIQNASKETFKIAIKAMLSIAKNNGISTKEIITTEETIEYCKKGFPNFTKNIGVGVAKCSNSLVKYAKPHEITLQDIGIDIFTLLVPQSKPLMDSICYTEKIVFSVVDEDFANCLAGLDSNLNN